MHALDIVVAQDETLASYEKWSPSSKIRGCTDVHLILLGYAGLGTLPPWEEM